MTSTRRIFITLWPSDAVRERLQDLLYLLDSARAVNSNNYHLTLAFLGEVQITWIDKINDKLAHIRGPVIRESIDLWGSFPRPGAVWVGPSKPSPSLFLLRKNIVSACQEFTDIDLPRSFVPHITLLRKASTEMVDAAKHLPPIRPIVWESSEFCLVQSNKGKYQTLARFALNRG